MNNFKIRCSVFLLIILLLQIPVKAQDRTVGLFLNNSASFNGYTLFAPLEYTSTYIIDNAGRLIHSWEGTNTPGMCAYLLDNGNLLRAAVIDNPFLGGGGEGGLIQEFNWEGDLIWEFKYSSDQYRQHHDVEKLPNGNVLVIAWENKSAEEAITAGRNPDLMMQNELWPDHIIEIQPDSNGSANIVWEWHIWDHLIQEFDPSALNYGVVSDHPELIDINFVGTAPNPSGADWNHINSVDYNEELDQIMLSVRNFCEIWVIDHSTTSGEAAGHTGGNSGIGGDLLYRWGNPQTYNAGNATEQKLFLQHDAHWIQTGLPGEGNILIFNNGLFRPDGNYSTIDEITPPVDQNGNYSKIPGVPYGPENLVWIYTASNPGELFAPNVSGSQRQPNGNTLICNGPRGKFFEVTNNGELVWLYINPVVFSGPIYYEDPIPGIGNWVFRAYRYSPDYPGFDGRDLTPGEPIELYPTNVEHTNPDLTPEQFELLQNNPNPFNPTTTISYSLPREVFVNLVVYDILGNQNSFSLINTHSVNL
ncbi:MAG: aryl-sulfate sulfotransferase [Ignavibacteriaceae bacterium]